MATATANIPAAKKTTRKTTKPKVTTRPQQEALGGIDKYLVEHGMMKQDIKHLDEAVQEIKKCFDKVDDRFDEMDAKFDRIYALIFGLYGFTALALGVVVAVLS